MSDLLSFNKMLTPKLITLIFWLGLVAVVVSGVSMMFGGFSGFTVGSFFKGLFFIVIAGVGTRVWCELLIVLFKMNDALQDIRNK